MSTVISAQLVKELRDQTGAPMMDTKRALQEAEGDMEVAKRLLRERGMASAAKRASRETTEGKVGYRVDGGTGVIVGIGCETTLFDCRRGAFRCQLPFAAEYLVALTPHWLLLAIHGHLLAGPSVEPECPGFAPHDQGRGLDSREEER